MMTAAVLAGGLGTRLRSVVADRPKVLAPVAGRRFLAYLLDKLADAGFERAVICTGYLGEQVSEAFGERWRKLYLRYSQERDPLGTAGALRLALGAIDSDQVLVLNGDSFCDVDISALAEFHRTHQAQVTIALADVPDVSRYGAVQLNVADAVRGFSEKGSVGPGLINAGVYLLDRQLIESIPSGSFVSIERDCLPSWVGKGLFGFRGGTRFLDIGTPESFASAQVFFSASDDTGICGPGRIYALLDRDGTVNAERNYLSHPDEVEILPGVIDGMTKMRNMGMGLAIVSNQSGLGRSYFDVAQLERIHNRLRALLGERDLAVDGIYYCPHEPADACECRKPKIGMAVRAASELGFDPQQAFVVGDKLCDIEMGARLRATTLLVRTGYGHESEAAGVSADYNVDDLSQAADVMATEIRTKRQLKTALSR